MTRQQEATVLYRIRGAEAALLYVGITSSLERRMQQHAEKAWWREVRAIDTETYGTRAEALAAEAAAIATEGPRYNRAGQSTPRARKRDSAPRANSTGKKNLVSIAEAAEYLGVCTKTIRRYIADGTVSAYRVPGKRMIRIDQTDLECILHPLGGRAWA